MSDPFGWLRENLPLSDEETGAVAQNAEVLRDQELKDIEHAKLFYDVFTQGRGPELLEELRSCTIELSSVTTSRARVPLEIALAPEQWVFIREGQNSIVRMIEERIRRATTPPQNAAQQEGESNA